MIAERKPILDPTIFRTYDIRGVAGKTLNDDDVFVIGKALGATIQEYGEKQLVMARDGRLSSPVLSKALIEGLVSSGCDVINLGMQATPLLYFALKHFAVTSGVMLTGSHNPADYNGIKAVIAGKSMSAQQIQELYQRILERRFVNGRGTIHEEEIIPAYLAAIQKDIKLKRPLRIIVDCGNGAASSIASLVYKTIGCEVQELYCQVDGRFPNHHPDPSQIENLQDLIATVKENQADLGLAFDGDGDRLGVVTNHGKVICADRLLMLFAQDLLQKNPQAKIVFDVKCSMHLATLIKKLGGEPLMWKTGHSLIKTKVAETNALLAGEMSGHLFFKDRWNGFDDAIYAGARLLEILANSADDCEQLFADIPDSINTPELKIAVNDNEKFTLMDELRSKANFSEAQEVLDIDGLRVNFKEGWGLVRPSNTTPYLIVRFEANNEIVLKKIQNLFRDWILTVRPDLVLPF